jgi:hypothetical protein
MGSSCVSDPAKYAAHSGRGGRLGGMAPHGMVLCCALFLSACATPKAPQAETSVPSSAASVAAAPVVASVQARPENLRLVLRSGAEIAAAKQSAESIVAQPLVGDLWQVLAVKSDSTDSTNLFRLATAADLDQMRLAPGDAFALGQQNAIAALPPLMTVTHDLTPHQIGVIQSKEDETSRVLATKDWSALARQLDGRLLIAVPASDTVIYCEENGTQSVRTFAAAARDMAAQSGHAVSPALLRWTPAGWQSVVVP